MWVPCRPGKHPGLPAFSSARKYNKGNHVGLPLRGTTNSFPEKHKKAPLPF